MWHEKSDAKSFGTKHFKQIDASTVKKEEGKTAREMWKLQFGCRVER